MKIELTTGTDTITLSLRLSRILFISVVKNWGQPCIIDLSVQKGLAAEIWGSPDAIDAVGAYTPMHPAKAKMAKWALLRKELHDPLSLCNWMGPWVASPLKERGYRGDDSIESMLYRLATGDKKDRQELDRTAECIFVLHRALTIRDIGTKDMRTQSGMGSGIAN